MTSKYLELHGRRLKLLTQKLTKKVYNQTAPVYSISALLFHTKAHRRCLDLAGSLEGKSVLEVPIGSGQLFSELVRRNRSGFTAGVDLSPRMVSVVQRRMNGNGFGGNGNSRNGAAALVRDNGRIGGYCLQAAGAQSMPFADGSFDVLFNCYLLELLKPVDIERTLKEFRRVLRPGGKLLIVDPSDHSNLFRAVYNSLGFAVPAFWGRVVAREVHNLLEAGGFELQHNQIVSQTFYPSMVTMARRT